MINYDEVEKAVVVCRSGFDRAEVGQPKLDGFYWTKEAGNNLSGEKGIVFDGPFKSIGEVLRDAAACGVSATIPPHLFGKMALSICISPSKLGDDVNENVLLSDAMGHHTEDWNVLDEDAIIALIEDFALWQFKKRTSIDEVAHVGITDESAELLRACFGQMRQDVPSFHRLKM